MSLIIEESLGKTSESLKAKMLNLGRDLRRYNFLEQNFRLISCSQATDIKINLIQQ